MGDSGNILVTDGGFPPGHPPCPGCGEPGFSIQTWVGQGDDKTQLWQCAKEPDECRVEEYRPREQDPQESPGGMRI